MSPKIRYIAEHYNMTTQETLLLAKCLFIEGFAECLVDGSYVLFAVGNVLIETTLAVAYVFTQEYRNGHA